MTQHYACKKIVMAWQQEKDGQPGYTVKYEDGYTSWSPAGAFESGYTAIGHVGHLPPFHQRLWAEKELLDEKYSALHDFTFTEKFAALGSVAQLLLLNQMEAMCSYSRILGLRLARLSPPNQNLSQ